MKIEKIVIDGESGYCCVDEAYKDRLVITPTRISYKYIPEIESELNPKRKWSYRTGSSRFAAYYAQVANKVEDIIHRDLICECTDLGSIVFTVTYSDGSTNKQAHLCMGDEFRDCFLMIKEMIPACEEEPAVLWTGK